MRYTGKGQEESFFQQNTGRSRADLHALNPHNVLRIVHLVGGRIRKRTETTAFPHFSHHLTPPLCLLHQPSTDGETGFNPCRAKNDSSEFWCNIGVTADQGISLLSFFRRKC